MAKLIYLITILCTARVYGRWQDWNSEGTDVNTDWRKNAGNGAGSHDAQQWKDESDILEHWSPPKPFFIHSNDDGLTAAEEELLDDATAVLGQVFPDSLDSLQDKLIPILEDLTDNVVDLPPQRLIEGVTEVQLEALHQLCDQEPSCQYNVVAEEQLLSRRQTRGGCIDGIGLTVVGGILNVPSAIMTFFTGGVGSPLLAATVGTTGYGIALIVQNC